MKYEVTDDTITLIDNYNQKLQFMTDGNGDYYFTLYSNYEARSGDNYSFIIDEDNSIYNLLKSFIEQTNNFYSANPDKKTPYFIIKANEVRIADQNKSIMEAESLKISLSDNKIKLIFSDKFPASIRICGVGRQDHYPFFIPIIDLFEKIQETNKANDSISISNEEIKNLQQAMNDYLVETHTEYSEIYNNLELFYEIASQTESILYEYFKDLEENIDYSKISKMSLFDKVAFIKKFYESHNIDFDLDKYISDGTVNFVYYDYLNDNNDLDDTKLRNFAKGDNDYEGTHKFVNICENGFVTDILVAIHELSHLRDQPDNQRNQVSDLLTEALAYAEELICSDDLSELGYEEDLKTFRTRLYSNCYYLSEKMKAMYKIFLLYEKFGDISESSYEQLYKTKDGYEPIIKWMTRFTEKRDFGLYRNSWYVLAFPLGTYLYYEYKKDNSFMNNITLLHEKINNSDVLDCLSLMNLSDLGNENKEKLAISLTEMKNVLTEESKEIGKSK